MGCTIAVQAWNNHAIPAKGIPIRRMRQNYHAACIDPNLIPTVETAVTSFLSTGGSLAMFPHLGEDCLDGREDLKSIRQSEFSAVYPDFSAIFYAIINGNTTLFHDVLKHFISITDRVTSSM